MFGRAQTADSGVENDHLLSHRVAGRVGIEAAVDGIALRQQCGKLAGIGASSGRGHTDKSVALLVKTLQQIRTRKKAIYPSSPLATRVCETTRVPAADGF